MRLGLLAVLIASAPAVWAFDSASSHFTNTRGYSESVPTVTVSPSDSQSPEAVASAAALPAAAETAPIAAVKPPAPAARAPRPRSLVVARAKLPKAKAIPASAPAPAAPAPARRPLPAWPWLVGLGAAAALLARGTVKLRSGRARSSASVEMTAHALKSPLSAIEASLDLMIREGGAAVSTEAVHRWVDDARRLKATTSSLRRSIAQLLEMSQIESGGLRLSRRLLDLADLASEAVRLYEAQARRQGVTLTLKAGAQQIEGDPARLTEVLHNLLSNALKFTPRGGRIEVSLHKQGSRARCTVSDTGLGIDSECMGRLFGKFARLPVPAGAPPVNREGTGLGLYLSKAVVEAHGGQIWAESAPGRGSKFLVPGPLA